MEPRSPGRRRILQGAAAGAAGALLPQLPPFQSAALAQQKPAAASQVLGAPRYALVIGNDRYKDSPLRNPVNDARAITTELQAVDFSVSMLLDASLEDMRKAVVAFGQEIARRKAVGLFYFAGHAIQLSWRNYLLPVDTSIGNIDEVKGKAVDLGQLLESMGRAGNPANIVILDACRNNPFGKDFRVEQRGLSQVDAPVGTLLAYATAPGNVAIDGEGTNGLYTENLLKEIRVPDAKVEDIFKRVRLAVRRSSRGLQVPWESTSLEDDFYFQLPEELRKVAAAERERRAAAEAEAQRRYEQQLKEIEAQVKEKERAEAERRRLTEAARKEEAERLQKEEAAREAQRQADAARRRRLEEERVARARDEAAKQKLYEEQLATWERVKASSDPAVVEAFLYRYPSGQFTELAQFHFDRLLAKQGERRIEVVNAPENPFTKGTAKADTAFKVGDTYAYHRVDKANRNEDRQQRHSVTSITDSEVHFNNGLMILDLLGNVVKLPDGRRFTARQDLPLEYAVGRRWASRVSVVRTQGDTGESTVDFEYRIVTKERITVPAGTFECYKLEGRGAGTGMSPRGPAQIQVETNIWMAPAVARRPIAAEGMRRVFPRTGPNFLAEDFRQELVSFKQG